MRLCLAEYFIAELAQVNHVEELQEVMRKAAKQLGFDHFALYYHFRRIAEADQSVLLHTYPGDWAELYLASDLGAQDPVRRACEHSLTGFAWKDLSHFIPLNMQDNDFMRISRKNGLGQGYTIPRHLPGECSASISFAMSPEHNLPAKMIPVAEIVGAVALDVTRRIVTGTRKPTVTALTRRQRESVLWSARGKTAAETAILMHISEQTVIQHLKLARERYGVHCRQSLILCALFDGAISFGDIFHR